MIFVDASVLPFRGQMYCHMICDEPEGEVELIAFAVSIGLKPEWIQKAGTYRAHFDINPKNKAKAIAAGAREIGRKEFIEIRKRRTGHPKT